jgi:PAS domain S-box-containing protein
MPTSNPRLRHKPPVILCYAVAALSVTAALIIARWLALNLQSDAPVSLFLCAVMLSGLLGGIGPGVLAALLSFLAFDYYFVFPIYSLAVEVTEIPRILIFALAALFVAWLGATPRSVAESLRQAHNDLYGTVQELKRTNVALQTENAERKRAEEAVRRSEDHLRMVTDTIPALVWSALPDGSVDFINQRHREFTGLSLDDVGGWRWTAVIHPEDCARFVDEWRTALATGEALETEARLRRACGDHRWLAIRAVPIRDESGKIVKWYGTKTDITARKQAEEAVRESEQRYLSLFENMAEGVAYLRMLFEDSQPQDAIYLEVNPAWKRLTGLDDVVGRNVSDVTPGIREVNPEFFEHAGKVAITGQTERFETYSTRLKKWFSVSAYCPRYEHVIVVLDDITERKQAEDAVHKSEDRLRLVIDTIPTMAWSVRPDGVVDFLNQRWLDYIGLSLEQYVEEPTGPIHPEDIPRVLEQWNADMVAEKPYEVEMRLRRADGEYRWFLVRTEPLRDERGNIVKWFGSSVDIEDRKRAEEALRESQADLAEAQRVAEIGSWSFDLVRNRISWSDELYRVFGISKSDFAGTYETFLSRVHADDRQLVFEANRQARSKGTPFKIEYRILLPNGELKTIRETGYASKDPEDNVVRLFGTSQDITERKLTENALRESEQRLNQLLEDRERISRDLHDNIIQMIYAIGLGLEESQRLLEEDAKAASSNLSNAIKELNAVIRDVRSYITWSEPEISDGRQLKSAIERLARTMEGTHRLHFRLKVNQEAADRLTPEEAAHVLHIAREAMSNSLRHSQARDGTVVLEARDGNIHLAVADVGVGFDTTDTGRYGQGLRNIATRARSLDARLEIISKPGLGVRIMLDIPMVKERA